MIDFKNSDKKIAEMLKPYRNKILQVVGVFVCFCVVSMSITFFGYADEKILGVNSDGSIISDGTVTSDGAVNSDVTVASDGNIISDGTIIGNAENSVPTGNYKTWVQSDPRWADKVLGASGDKMRDIGCAVTAAAILAVHSGSVTEDNFNPGILCDFLSANSGFNAYGDIYWSAITKLVPKFTYEGAIVLEGTKSQKIATIKAYTDYGYYISVAVRDYNHFVAVDYATDTDVYIIDPASSARTNLNYYPDSGVVALRLFKSTAAASDKPKPNPAPAFSSGYHFINAATGLNHRTGPGTSYSSNAVVPFGSYVYITEVQSSWGKYVWNGKEGWSSFEYLEKVLMGDIDGDVAVTSLDVICLVKYMGKKQTFTALQFITADCYYDSRINSQDLVALIRMVFDKK